MENEEYLREEKLSSEKIFDGVILHVVRDEIKLSNGNKSTREVIRHVGAVGVVPVTDNNEVIVERQYRYPLDEVITEIPAGKLDSKEEDRLSAAKRELQEETGITADTWTNLGDFHPAAAYSDERLTLYLAQGLHFGSQNLDDDELLNVKKVPISDLVDEIMDGTITDSKTIAAILKTARILGI